MPGKLLRTLLGTAALAAILCFSVQPALADTLDDIIKSGKVRIMVPIDVPIFGTPGPDGKPEGYDIDIANLIAKDLGVEAELIPGTGANRIPFLLTKKVDMVVMIMGATPERAKSVSFTSPYAPFYIGIFGPPSVKVTSADQTAGFKVGVPRGTTQDISFTEIAPKGVNIIRYEDDATTISALLAGQVDMIGSGNIPMKKVAQDNPGKVELKFVLRMSPGHIAVRRGEADLLQWLNTFIHYHKVNGDLNKLSLKWFEAPMPELTTF
jgi:polar amino acid transport system substrate-binding protein